MHGKVFSLIGLLVLSSITFAQVAAPIITTFAGGGPNGIPALVSNLKKPGWVAVDSFGNLFISDNNLNRVFEVTTDGILRTVVRTVYEDPNGMAFAPLGLTADDQGNLYIGSDYYIYKYDPETKALSVYAGDGTWSYKGENVPALSTGMFPQSVYWKNGNLYYCDLGTQRLRYIDFSRIRADHRW